MYPCSESITYEVNLRIKGVYTKYIHAWNVYMKKILMHQKCLFLILTITSKNSEGLKMYNVTCSPGYELRPGVISALGICKFRQWVMRIPATGEDFPVPPACSPVCVDACQHGGVCAGPGLCQCLGYYFGFACQYKMCLDALPQPAHGEFTGRLVDIPDNR